MTNDVLKTVPPKVARRLLTDLLAVAASLCRDNVPEGSLHDQDRAWIKKLRYAHHQEELPQ